MSKQQFGNKVLKISNICESDNNHKIIKFFNFATELKVIEVE